MLKGKGPRVLADFITEQVAGMLVLAGLCPNEEAALGLSREKLANGEALDRFIAMVKAQGGDARIVDDPQRLPQSLHVREMLYEEPETVWVKDVDARKIAEIVLDTGAGRRNADEPVDHAGGLSGLACVGDRLEPGNLLGRLHHSVPAREEEWVSRLLAAITFSSEAVQPLPLIHGRVT